MPRGGRTSTTRPKGNGAGWGGQSRPNKVAPKTDEGAEKGRRNARAMSWAEKQYRSMTREEVVVDLCGTLYAVAKDEKHGQRVLAADKLLNRLDGMPVARSEIKMSMDNLSDEQLAAIAAGGGSHLAVPEADTE